ncbi:MAG: competence protein CoiA family protein [Bacteroidota bacterium]
MIQIEFAHNQKKELIHINEVSKGTDEKYFCPSCGVDLLPKIGQINRKHFAHKENSCLGVSGESYYVPDKYVPKRLDAIGYHEWYYQNLEDYKSRLVAQISEGQKQEAEINELITKARAFLHDLGQSVKSSEILPVESALAAIGDLNIAQPETIKRLLAVFAKVRTNQNTQYCLVTLSNRKVNYKMRYSAKKKLITQSELGKYMSESKTPRQGSLKEVVILGAMSDLISQLWEWQNHSGVLEKSKVKLAEIWPALNREALVDQMSLYYLKISMPNDKVIYKIGITGRVMDERLREIRRDLAPLDVVSIDVVAFAPRMGHIEAWYKRRFADYRYAFQNHEEYFFFDHSKWFTALHKYAN